MAAINDPRGSREPKLGTVTVDVTLLHADIKKVAEKVTTAEMDIAFKRLEDQVWFLTTEYEKMEVRLEDQEGKAHRNIIRVVGVPEEAEGPSVELFLETLITDSLCPKRLLTFFTVERVHRASVPPPRRGAPPRTIVV
ncbi:hypothetical protein NDU88_002834 [Pleurodeles waltl]|uniref:Uncharacterized protein n=1 Tax=Pleurodeles waltl TaxID=8319 RepID=A0AAV7LH17_PLEWA|nr:hypothetical protein NDU88_002834 [Pleurodeles waltl]